MWQPITHAHTHAGLWRTLRVALAKYRRKAALRAHVTRRDFGASNKILDQQLVALLINNAAIALSVVWVIDPLSLNGVWSRPTGALCLLLSFVRFHRVVVRVLVC